MLALLIRVVWNMFQQFNFFKRMKENSLVDNTFLFPSLYVGVVVFSEVLPIFAYLGLVILGSRTTEEIREDSIKKVLMGSNEINDDGPGFYARPDLFSERTFDRFRVLQAKPQVAPP